MSLEPPSLRAPLLTSGRTWLAITLNAISVSPLAILLLLYVVDADERGVPLALSLFTLGLSAVGYLTWEIAYGSALSYMMPLHGAYHVPQRAWLLGTVARASFTIGATDFVLVLIADDRPNVILTGAALFAVILGVGATLFVAGVAA